MDILHYIRIHISLFFFFFLSFSLSIHRFIVVVVRRFLSFFSSSYSPPLLTFVTLLGN